MSKLHRLKEQFSEIINQSENQNFNKHLRKVIHIMDQIEKKSLSSEEKAQIEASISSYFSEPKPETEFKSSLKKMRKFLISDYGFVPPNHYLTLGVGIGLAIGTSLGISIGVPFENGVVFGPIIGSGAGIIMGSVLGMSMDRKKESEDRVLTDL